MIEGFLGRVDGIPVGVAALGYPVRDNTEKLYVEPVVDPDQRRRGYGSVLLAHLEARADQLGRTTRLVRLTYPTDAGEDHPNRAFATRHGYRQAHRDQHRVLHLPVEESVLEELAREAEPHHGGYTLQQYVGLPPEELLASYAGLLNAILTDAPFGEVAYEEGQLTPDDLREQHASLAEAGRTMYTTLALAPDGQAVAHSQLVVPAFDPGQVFQWDTLVHRDHRGRQLGVATKARNLQWVQGLHPDRRIVHTYNAVDNAPMIAVNDKFGFQPVSFTDTCQRLVASAPGRDPPAGP